MCISHVGEYARTDRRSTLNSARDAASYAGDVPLEKGPCSKMTDENYCSVKCKWATGVKIPKRVRRPWFLGLKD